MTSKEISVKQLKSATIRRTEKRALDLERANKIYSKLREGIKESCDMDIAYKTRRQEYVAARNKVVNIMYESGCKKYHISKVMGFNNALIHRAIRNNDSDTMYFSKEYPHIFRNIGSLHLSADDIKRRYDIADIIIAMDSDNFSTLEHFVDILIK